MKLNKKIIDKIRDVAIITFIFVIIICVLVAKVLSKDPEIISAAWITLEVVLVIGLLTGVAYSIVNWNKH